MIEFLLTTLTEEEHKKILLELSNSVKSIKEFAEKEQNKLQKRNETISYYNALESDPNLIYHLQKEARKFRKLKDKKRELECLSIMIKIDAYAPALLRKATILIDRGEFDKAIVLLDKMYGCESHDTLWAPALFQKARAAAIRNNKEDTIENLKKAMRTTIFFKSSLGHYSKRELIGAIRSASEFDKYRDMEEFQFVVNFEWEREDDIELENKMKRYFKEKNLNPEQLDPAQLGLIEYLCKYPESKIYLDFDLDEKREHLINRSKSVMIVCNDCEILKNLKNSRNVTYTQDKIEPFSWKLEEIKELTKPTEKTYNFDGIKYKKDDIETVLKIIEGYVHALIPDKPYPLILYSTSTFGGKEDYKVYTKRKSDNYSTIISPTLDNNV